MSIDIEGHEMEAIQGIDSNAVRINVLTIENIPDFNRNYGDPTLQDFMKKSVYKLYARIFDSDDIYVHKDFKF